jgi:hypothetical protein
MARCAYCGSETELFVNGTPVCVECDKARQPNRGEMPNQDGLAERKGRSGAEYSRLKQFGGTN